MNVRSALEGDATAWNQLVEQNPQATFFHLWQWREVVQTNFGFTPHYLIAEDSSTTRGILPLFHVTRPPFPSALISTPLCTYGGSVADCDQAHAELDLAAQKLAHELGVAYLEMRDLHQQREGYVLRDSYASFRKILPERIDHTLKAIPVKQRAEIRKGINAGVSRNLDEFFSIYSTSVRNLGSPVFRRSYYQSLLDVFGDQAEIITAYADGVGISSVMIFWFRDEVLLYYGGSLPAARELRSTQFMYWDVMNQAVERGTRLFDFGRSIKDTGTYRFKKLWGFEPGQLSYNYHLVRAATAPDLRPDNFRMLTNLWSHLPLPLANRLGPFAARLIV